jgi:hypothetical protein
VSTSVRGSSLDDPEALIKFALEQIGHEAGEHAEGADLRLKSAMRAKTDRSPKASAPTSKTRTSAAGWRPGVPALLQAVP